LPTRKILHRDRTQRAKVVELLRMAVSLEFYEEGSAIKLSALWEIEEFARRACIRRRDVAIDPARGCRARREQELAMMDPKHIKRGALIELRDDETATWIPLTVVSILAPSGSVECRTLANETILTTVAALVKDARPRPSDGRCRDCGYDAHDGPCVERRCSECGAEVSSRCVRHPEAPVHVYRRKRYLAEIEEDKPYPTREWALGLQCDLVEQMRVLRDAEQPRQNRVMITTVERGELLSALENAIRLIDLLPTEKRRGA
jgi:hypothetical protein